MDLLEMDIDRVHVLKHGKRQSPADRLKKLGEEYGELVAAVMNEDDDNVREEAADCLISVICVLQSYFRKDKVEMKKLIDNKLDELFERIGEKR